MTQCWTDSSKSLRSDGYTRMKTKDEYRDKMGHIVSYEVLRGDIEPGMVLHHICHNPACYNPRHLQKITRADHIREHRITDFSAAARRK